MENISNVLSSLDNLNKVFDVYVPSINKKIKFKGLTTKQQKEAVKAALDKSLAGLTFSNLANSIIIENCLEKINFLLIDRSYILVTLRALSLSSTITSEEGNLDISFIVNNNIQVPEDIKAIELADSGLKVSCSIPQLIKDTFINNETKKKIQPLPENDDLPKEAVGEMFINELLKYIDKITINDGNQPIDVIFNDIPFSQRVQIAEKLPLTLNSKIVNYINEVKLFEKKYFVSGGKDIDIDIDPTLFTV
jgi:hypothetical protein